MTTTDTINGKITDAALDVLRSRTGKLGALGPPSDPYTRTQIIRFLASYGDDNPLFWDEDYAATTRWRGVVAPPRMLMIGAEQTPFSVTQPLDAQRVTFMGEDVLQGVFAMISGSRTVFEQPVRIGDTLRCQRGPHDVIERASRMAGKSVELVNKTVFVNQRDELVATVYESVIRMEREAARANRRYLDVPEPRYTVEEMRSLSESYQKERAQRRGNTPRYWEDVTVGDDLITLMKGPLTITDIASYFMGVGDARSIYFTNRMKHLELIANPSARLVNPETNIEDNWVAAHWDHDFAQLSGIPRPYDEGPMRYDHLAHLVTDWMGDNAVLRELAATLRAPSLVGDLMWCTGKVANKRTEGGKKVVELELWITNQREEITTRGSAIVELASHALPS